MIGYYLVSPELVCQPCQQGQYLQYIKQEKGI